MTVNVSIWQELIIEQNPCISFISQERFARLKAFSGVAEDYSLLCVTTGETCLDSMRRNSRMRPGDYKILQVIEIARF